jgi:uronate dehydrogenase
MAEPIFILVTGCSGRVGRAAVAELIRRGHRVRGFDRVPAMDGPTDFVHGDVADRAAVDRAMEGIDCLVHLAATPDDDEFLTKVLEPNIIGLHHVMESARMAAVRRIVLASSGQVNWWQQQRGPLPVRVKDPPSTKYWYAATKMFMEAIGYSFSEVHGISVIMARLGSCPRSRDQVEEIAGIEWMRDVYLSPGDAGRFFACAIEAPASIRHAVVYATSKPARTERLDLSPAKELLGYEPQECWPEGTEIITGSRDAV